MKNNDCSLEIKLTTYEGSQARDSVKSMLDEARDEMKIEFQDSLWKIRYTCLNVDNNEDAVDYEVSFKVVKGAVNQANVSVSMVLGHWSKENYVLMPAAAYNGNRYKVSEQEYPPMLTREDEIGSHIPITITDVPRLNHEDGISVIELRTGDLATPAVGCFKRKQNKGFFMLTKQGTSLGDSGITVRENELRTQAVITLSAPAVRRYKYSMCNAKETSDDVGFDFNENDEVTLKFRLYFFDCNSIPELFDYFAKIRKDLTGQVQLRHEIPFSASWDILEEKYNRDNWQQADEFYRSSTSTHEVFGEWQTGWVGGAINTYPMFAIGNELSKERSFKTLDFLFSKVQAASGFFYGIHCKGKLYGDNFKDQEDISCVLMRKNADAIYFIVKQFMLLEQLKVAIPAHWKEGLKKACDAFVRLWENNGQLGQFVDVHKEKIIVGGSASAGIAPAGLVLSAKYFNETLYMGVASHLAQLYYVDFVKDGVTTGGPGEICQCPDSESAFALLESYVVLYEETGLRKWLTMAEDTAKLCATWCVSYDFEYPLTSEFSKLELRSAGSVWASVQNKHAAPGICTLSGLSLLKLYRATSNEFYLELLREIAHNIPQYVSREDRPLRISWDSDPSSNYSPPGWMGERVNTSDWEGKANVGGVLGGSCWCEVTNMLTYFEVPGIYIQKNKGIVCAIDHIDAEIVVDNAVQLRVRLSNTTKFTAKVKVLVEDDEELLKPLHANSMLEYQTIILEPNSTYTMYLMK
ncbi:hypothetical protein [Paenibacillus aceris]|uniref:Alpha-L-rhamnosidase six-hairpin glycosidase domain-containing protein n=1 Tax=Paenibacillus aceris TaxID=869555 RepID=A0ABS4I365_9BACL|nr:hypothetical protein [Paenibacillus aceris]MBP1965358.1 hypothetical protein [Paenibacillus aceris]NHW36041.1 hypothetical protein [Paenibacillus aceris]